MGLTQLKGAIFDLDGVITDTAHLHAKSWERMFNEFLRKDAEKEHKTFQPFDPIEEYRAHVDGKPRYDGVFAFLKSRNIQLPLGTPEDPPDALTICGLGNKKDKYFNEALRKKGPEVFDTSVAFIRNLKERGVKLGVASSSKNCRVVLEMAGLIDLFETIVDGVVSAELGLKGKPEPDIFTTAASNLGLIPAECMVTEDAIAGVQAAKAGNFALAVGVARGVDGALLKRFGADVVVTDLGELPLERVEGWFLTGLDDDSWTLSYDGFDPGDEKLRETLTAVGNGYMGVRGSFASESASFSFYPATYLAGIFNKLATGVHGKEIWNNDFVNCPNWNMVEFSIGSSEFTSPLSMEILSYSQKLDMRRAIAFRSMICKDKLGRITRVSTRRLASMANPHICALMYEITPLNYSEPLTIRSSIDGNVINDGVPRYRKLNSRHLEFVNGGSAAEGVYLHVRTSHSRYDILMNAKTAVYENGKPLDNHIRVYLEGAKVCGETVIQAQENNTYGLEKIVSVFTSLDKVEDLKNAAAQELEKVKSFRGVLGPHERAWKAVWDKADVVVTGDRFIQRTLRLHIYHLLVTASPHNVDLDVGMPARGLHGEAYRGHIFWDELYILPFFDLRFPDIAKALLKYRYNRLESARQYARANGCPMGAMFPWQTADDGGEETQEVHYNPESGNWDPDLSRRQRHVSIAVFYNVWRYVTITGDSTFLKEQGAELMLEIARCWAALARFDSKDKRYHIEGVMGPDEFHEKLPGDEEPGLKDNAYTNIMVVWLLEKSMELIARLPKSILDKLRKKIGFKVKEADLWRKITTRMNVIMDEKTKIISQFDGYMDLDELDWDAYRKRYYSIHRMDRILKAEGDSPDHYKVAKQADTLMTFYVLDPEEVARILRQLGYDPGDPVELLKANYAYYEPRTSHGSTLSKVVHAVISSHMAAEDTAWKWFTDSMRSDVYDTQGGTTVEGIHTGVMGGTLDVVARYFAGLVICEDMLCLSPNLPVHWRRLSFKVRHRRVRYTFDITPQMLTVHAKGNGGKTVYIRVKGNQYELAQSRPKEIPLT